MKNLFRLLSYTSQIFIYCLLGFNSFSQIIDFEPTSGFNPIEGTPLDNAYMINSHGISFHLDVIGGAPPTVSRTGNPRTAFASSMFTLGCGSSLSQDDDIYDGGSGCFFITDDGLLTTATYDLIIDYQNDNCCSSASGELLDVDQGEAWDIEIYTTGQSTPIAFYTLCGGGGCDFPAIGDGTRSPWSIDISPNTIDYLKFIYNSSTGPAAVGIGFDNFEFCTNEPTQIEITESIDLCDIDTMPVIWRGITISAAGSYVDSSSLLNPCDTLFSLIVTADQIINTEEIIHSCNVSDTMINATQYATSEGCDSFHTIITYPLPSDTLFETIYSCDVSLEGMDSIYSIPGTPCDTVVIGTYLIFPSDTTIIIEPTCDPSNTSTEFVYLQNSFGCDSTIIIEHPFIDTIIFTESINYQCGILDTSIWVQSLVTDLGCDSIHTEYIIPIYADTVYGVISSCDNSLIGMDTSFILPGNPCDTFFIGMYNILPSDTTTFIEPTCNINNTSDVYQYLENQAGCDSIVITQHPYLDSIVLTHSVTYECGLLDSVTQITIDTTILGCDSIHTEYLVPLFADSIYNIIPTCDSSLVGIDSINIIMGPFCDTVQYSIFILMEPDTFNIFESSCDTGILGISFNYLQGVNGCDSIVRLEVSLMSDTIYTYETEYDCNTLDALIDTMQYTTIDGCDSFHIKEIFPSISDTSYIHTETCDSRLINLDSFNLIPGSPCDSIIVYTFNLIELDSTFFSETTCTLTEADTQTFLLTNQLGCDSVIVFYTIYRPDSVLTESIEYSCLATDTIMNQESFSSVLGCDSIHTTVILPYSVDSIFDTLYTCVQILIGFDSIQTIPGTPCDTILLINFQPLFQDTTFITEYLCGTQNPDTLSIIMAGSSGCDSLIITYQFYTNDTLYSESYEYSCQVQDTIVEVQALTTTTGCDSIHTFSTVPLGHSITIQTGLVCDSLMAGIDTIYLSNQAGCDSIVVTNYEQVQIGWVNLVPDSAVGANDPVLLRASSSFTPSQITWIPPGPNTTEWLIIPDSDATYTIILEDSLGCTVSASVLITILENGRLFIPNVFSPNNDGINDAWKVYPTSEIIIQKIEIFERWGNKVWESNTNSGWDGTFNGKIADQNVFVAVVRYLNTQNEQINVESREIHLIR